DPAAEFGAYASERGDVVDIEARQRRLDFRCQASGFDELPERERGGRKTAGDSHPLSGELTDHLPQRRILAADLRKIGHAELVELDDSPTVVHSAFSKSPA